MCVCLTVTLLPSRTCCLGTLSRDNSPGYQTNTDSETCFQEGGPGVWELLRGDRVGEVETFSSSGKKEVCATLGREIAEKKGGIQKFMASRLTLYSLVGVRGVCDPAGGGQAKRGEVPNGLSWPWGPYPNSSCLFPSPHFFPGLQD